MTRNASWGEVSPCFIGFNVEDLNHRHVLKTDVLAPVVKLDKRTENEPVKVEDPILYGSASMSRNGKEIILKVVNIWGGEVAADISLAGVVVDSLETVTLASRHLKGENTSRDQFNIAPVARCESDASSRMQYLIKPCSFTVFRYFLK